MSVRSMKGYEGPEPDFIISTYVCSHSTVNIRLSSIGQPQAVQLASGIRLSFSPILGFQTRLYVLAEDLKSGSVCMVDT